MSGARMTREDALRLAEEVAALRKAARMIETLITAEPITGFPSDAHAIATIGGAQILIGEATRGLTAAYETFRHYDARPATQAHPDPEAIPR